MFNRVKTPRDDTEIEAGWLDANDMRDAGETQPVLVAPLFEITMLVPSSKYADMDIVAVVPATPTSVPEVPIVAAIESDTIEALTLDIVISRDDEIP